jgi:hypothetical protein
MVLQGTRAVMPDEVCRIEQANGDAIAYAS